MDRLRPVEASAIFSRELKSKGIVDPPVSATAIRLKVVKTEAMRRLRSINGSFLGLSSHGCSN